MFTTGRINFSSVRKAVAASGFRFAQLHSSSDQLHFLINEVKLTFFEYPFPITANVPVQDAYRIPDLLTLAAMKAFALGGRGKWKDYVDLYFIIKGHYSVAEITEKGKEIFADSFNGGLFVKQLGYFADIDHREEVVYLPGFEVDETTVKTFLTEASLAGF